MVGFLYGVLYFNHCLFGCDLYNLHLDLIGTGYGQESDGRGGIKSSVVGNATGVTSAAE